VAQASGVVLPFWGVLVKSPASRASKQEHPALLATADLGDMPIPAILVVFAVVAAKVDRFSHRGPQRSALRGPNQSAQPDAAMRSEHPAPEGPLGQAGIGRLLPYGGAGEPQIRALRTQGDRRRYHWRMPTVDDIDDLAAVDSL
jgi:hypothetical protein